MNPSTLEIPCEIPAERAKPRRAVPPHGPHAAHLVSRPAASAPRSTASRARCEESKANLDKVAIVSGIGCTGRVAGYANLDSFHTTHGRAIPFATGLKLANPELQVVVYSGDGDLFAIGGNHFIHAARRNMDLKVICVNNLTYAMTGGQTAPTTPGQVISATSPYGVFEPSFNLVQLAEAAGAAYVARWTTYHVKQLARSMGEMLNKKGFCFIEILSPCPTLYQRRNKMGDGLEQDATVGARQATHCFNAQLPDALGPEWTNDVYRIHKKSKGRQQARDGV